jgi:hypothetical protein
MLHRIVGVDTASKPRALSARPVAMNGCRSPKELTLVRTMRRAIDRFPGGSQEIAKPWRVRPQQREMMVFANDTRSLLRAGGAQRSKEQGVEGSGGHTNGWGGTPIFPISRIAGSELLCYIADI